MTKVIIVDEFHLTVSAPHRLARQEIEQIRKTLDTNRFQIALRCAASDVFQRFPPLAKARFTITR